MLQTGTVPQTRIPATVLAAANQTYELSFNPSTGFFTLTGTGSTPTPALLQIIVTEPNSSITITCTGELSFEASARSPISWRPNNTLQNPVVESFSPTSVELFFPTPPQPWDKVGFTLSTRFVSGSNQTINNLQSEFFVTAETLSAPPSLELVYRPADGSFLLGDSTPDPIIDAEVTLRLGGESSHQGGQVLITLITEGNPQPGSQAAFATPAAVQLTNGNTFHRLTSNTVLMDIPFSNGSGVGLNFIIQYEGATIFSPDPIIIDKMIGSNPGPGF